MTNGQSAHRTRVGESPVGVRPAWLINNRLPICGNRMRKDSCEKETSAVRRELNPAAYYWRGGCRLAGSHLGSGLYISTCVITIYHKPPVFFSKQSDISDYNPLSNKIRYSGSYHIPQKFRIKRLVHYYRIRSISSKSAANLCSPASLWHNFISVALIGRKKKFNRTPELAHQIFDSSVD